MACHSRELPSRRAAAFEALEDRRLFCLAHLENLAFDPPTEVVPGFVATPERPYLNPPSNGLEGDPEPAKIVWANRLGDGFDAVFGASASTARAVVDQVLRDFERMIGSFNYYLPGGQLQAYISMMGPGSNGLGAAASIVSTLGGKPYGTNITIQRGLNGLGSGFFLDPTPAEHSEFLGNIQNPFCGDAPAGSPANGLADFYTLVALELTHGVGLFGNYFPGWAALTRPTGVPEQGEGFDPGGGTSVGTYFVFDGPSIQHLLTSNNGGRTGSDFNEAIHSAGHSNNANPVTISFEGKQWSTSNDIGNAVYERSRRYLPNYAFGLMLKDAYGYASTNPAIYNSFNATRTSTGEVVVRLPTANSADTLSIDVNSSGKMVVSYDLGIDAPGVGPLPGPGDLPAWTTEFDAATVTSVRIETGDGADTITLSNLGALPVTLNSGPGADSLSLVGSSNVMLVGNQDLGAITIDAASTLKLQPGVGATLLTTGGISGAGTLDLADGALIDRSTNTVAQLRDRLVAGYAGGAWNGSASSVRSSVAAASASLDSLSLGVASQIAPTSLGGFALQPTDRVVRYALAGDANLDRTVNFDDLLRLAANYNTPTGAIGSSGEFNFDAAGAVNFDDLLLLAANYNASLPGTLGGLSLRGGPVGGMLVDDGDGASSIAGDVLA
jgi:hypothetical protein